ncbi:MAG: NAD(+) synthase [Ruminococcaceae bacterium]|nr:NAD(+) synthase [Oscillospiraceae bacterium]
MRDGFIRLAAASPALRVADCAFNAQQIADAARMAAQDGAHVLATPELGITGYSCGDLFQQPTLLDAAEAGLRAICEATASLPLLLVVGLPLRHRGKLYNCAAILSEGHVLGLVPKSHPANHGSFQELRLFSPAFGGIERFETGFLRGVPIGTQLLFRCDEQPALIVAAEVCKDLWVPAPPSIFHAVAGATVIVNLSANNETIGMANRRRELVRSHSARLICAYLYAESGPDESTTDGVFAGHNMVAENGALLAEAKPFGPQYTTADIDLGRIAHDRLYDTAFPDAGGEGYLTIGFSLPLRETALAKPPSQSPFVTQNPAKLAEHCETILNIQAAGLRKRLQHVGQNVAVLGISGGLDSTLALLATARAFQAMGQPAANILAVTLPGFGTTGRTQANAEKLCQLLGATLLTIDIRDTVLSHFDAIGHSESQHDEVFENAQARMRTLTLMDLANQKNGMMVGTGDLSELALGWATYNGDHMSMYGVNAGIPKTLIRKVVAHEAAQKPELQAVLQDILDTPVSPELLPAKDGEIAQQTEDIVGPYLLHDFFLYYTLRWAFTPRKVFRLAKLAFAGTYDTATLWKWMDVFYRRFFAQQYKRSCLADGPAVGRVSLSPRGAWHMPSDASAAVWLAELAEIKKQLA